MQIPTSIMQAKDKHMTTLDAWSWLDNSMGTIYPRGRDIGMKARLHRTYKSTRPHYRPRLIEQAFPDFIPVTMASNLPGRCCIDGVRHDGSSKGEIGNIGSSKLEKKICLP
jgi:hypothetical protein